MAECNVNEKPPASPKKFSGAVFVLLVLVVLVPALYAQTSGQSSPAQATETPTIVKNVDEVTLDLVVRKKNKPVLDLKPGDITVADGGSPVTLSDLRLVTKTSGSDHLVTLVFDRLGPAAATNARSIAAKILKTVPAEGFSFSVLRIDGRLKLFQEYTSDRAALTKAVFATTAFAIEGGNLGTEDVSAAEEKRLIAVAQTGADLAGVRVSVADRSNAQMMLAALRESQRIVQDQRTQPSLGALLALTREQAQVPGRKIVFYFAQGLQTDPNLGDMLRNVVGAANRSGVTVYAIDANTLSEQVSEGLLSTIAMGGMRAASAQTPAGPSYSGGTSTSAQPVAQLPPGMQTEISEQTGRFETGDPSDNGGPLAQLALSTGGAYVPAGQSVKKTLQRLIEDMTTYYEASYVPPIKDFDGKFRAVLVKPVAKGLKIKSRAGYFAVPPGSSGAGMRAFEAPLMKALSEPELPTDIKFRAAVLRLGDLADGNANAVVVEVPLAAVELRQDSNTNLFSAHVAIVAQIKNKAGTVLEHFSEDVPRHGSLETIEKARSEVVTLQRHFVAGPGEYVVEVAVMDRNGGKTGAQRNTFEIAPAPAGPALSDLSLVSRTDPFNVDTDAFEPMRYDNARVVPSLSGHVSTEAKNVTFL